VIDRYTTSGMDHLTYNLPLYVGQIVDNGTQNENRATLLVCGINTAGAATQLKAQYFQVKSSDRSQVWLGKE
jgi:hypothetical protein